MLPINFPLYWTPSSPIVVILMYVCLCLHASKLQHWLFFLQPFCRVPSFLDDQSVLVPNNIKIKIKKLSSSTIHTPFLIGPIVTSYKSGSGVWARGDPHPLTILIFSNSQPHKFLQRSHALLCCCIYLLQISPFAICKRMPHKMDYAIS